MAKKKMTFADQAKTIRNKYYKNREAGDDTMTDEAFNREMKQLMVKQEAVKPKDDQQSQTHTMPDGTEMDGATHEGATEQFEEGGNLPKYAFGGGFNADGTIPGIGSRYGIPGAELQQQSSIGADPSQGLGDPNSPFQPRANPLMPLIGIGANAISNSILSKNAEKRKESLLNNIGVDLGRVNAQKVDFSRDRANIRSNQALSEASGRYAARGARSASEAARISNAARLGSQRISGNQLSQSLQGQESQNAQLRARADEQNRQLGAQESQMEQRQRSDIEQRYGDVPAQLKANFVQSTGQSVINYLGENQRMKKDYDFLRMSQPDLDLNYQEEFDKLTPFQQKLRRAGIGNIKPTITARNNGKK